MKFEDLQKANATIKTVSIKGKQYAEVNERIRVFRMLYPNGTITTDLVSLENGMCIFKATATDENGSVLSTGHAYERENAGMINKTSFIENCETSAVGRCLGMLGIGIDTSIASYEEVSNAIAQQTSSATAPEPVKAAQAESSANDGPATKEQQEKFAEYIKSQGYDLTDVCKRFKITKASTRAQLNEVIRRIQVQKIQEGK